MVLSSLSEKTRESSHSQMSLERQPFLLSYVYTLDIGLARVGHVDLFTAEESCLHSCYLYGTYPPIIQHGVLSALLFLFCSHKSKEEPSYVLGQVFLMIDGICKSYFPSVEFHCGPACPSETCPGYQDDYFTSPLTAEGNGTRRRHVYDIRDL